MRREMDSSWRRWRCWGSLLFISIGGEIVMLLWNWLLPPLFGWRQITFWQALGLLALCRILFGGWGRRGSGRSDFRRRRAERWERMTPEERERFRQGMWGRWASVPPAARANGDEAELRVDEAGEPIPVSRQTLLERCHSVRATLRFCHLLHANQRTGRRMSTSIQLTTTRRPNRHSASPGYRVRMDTPRKDTVSLH